MIGSVGEGCLLDGLLDGEVCVLGMRMLVIGMGGGYSDAHENVRWSCGCLWVGW